MAPPAEIWLHPKEYGSTHRNKAPMAPPTGIWLLLQEYGSSYRNMGSCYRNTVLPTQICCYCSVTKVMSDSVTLWTIVCQAPWGSPGKDTGVGCHFLLQESSRTRDWTRLLHWQVDSLTLSHQGIPTGIELFLLLRDQLWLYWQGYHFTKARRRQHPTYSPCSSCASVPLRKLLPLSVGWIWWLASNEENRAKVMKCHVWD